MAAQYGYIKCLNYAHDNGCPWDVDVFDKAEENENIDCMKYYIEN